MAKHTPGEQALDKPPTNNVRESEVELDILLARLTSDAGIAPTRLYRE